MISHLQRRLTRQFFTEEKLNETDLTDSLKLIEGMTEDSLQQLKLDIEEFMDDEKQEEKNKEDVNPFSALFGLSKKKEKKETKKSPIEILKQKGIKKDTYAEKYLRNIAEANAINSCYNIFDIYKKSHGMASFPFVEDVEPSAPRTAAEELFGFK